MSKRNPDGNSVLQALLDCADSGYGGLTIDQLITKLSNEGKTRASLQEKWNGHAYPEKSLSWTQQTIDQRVFMLSDIAYKVLTLFGMYCHQSGLIQVKRADIMAALGAKERVVKYAISELRACGAIRVDIPSVRHAAPVYAVNPALFNKGSRRKIDASEFVRKLNIPPESYLLNGEPELSVRVETIYSGDAPTFNRLSLVSPGQRKGPAAATTDPRSDKSVTPTVTVHHRARKRKPSSPDDGQMSIYDWLGGADN